MCNLLWLGRGPRTGRRRTGSDRFSRPVPPPPSLTQAPARCDAEKAAFDFARPAGSNRSERPCPSPGPLSRPETLHETPHPVLLSAVARLGRGRPRGRGMVCADRRQRLVDERPQPPGREEAQGIGRPRKAGADLRGLHAGRRLGDPVRRQRLLDQQRRSPRLQEAGRSCRRSTPSNASRSRRLAAGSSSTTRTATTPKTSATKRSSTSRRWPTTAARCI